MLRQHLVRTPPRALEARRTPAFGNGNRPCLGCSVEPDLWSAILLASFKHCALYFVGQRVRNAFRQHFANDRDFLDSKKLHAYIRTYEDYKLLTN